MSRRAPVAIQTPERSGLPSAARGTGRRVAPEAVPVCADDVIEILATTIASAMSRTIGCFFTSPSSRCCLPRRSPPGRRRVSLATLDRYAARCVNFVFVVTRIAVLGARSAPRDTGNQPRVSRDIKGCALGWFIDLRFPPVAQLPTSAHRETSPPAPQPDSARREPASRRR